MTGARPVAVPATAAAAAVLYAVVWVGWVQGWAWVDGPDGRALAAAHRLAQTHGWWVPLWDGLSSVSDPAVWRVLVVVPVVLELRRRRVRTAVFLAVCVWGSGIVSVVAKHLAGRERPVTRLVEASGMSFPSGHALGVLVAVGALLAVYAHLARGYGRTAVVVGSVVLCAAVGVARVALNVHHPSDVLAGWALGFAWLVACLWVYRGRYTGRTR